MANNNLILHIDDYDLNLFKKQYVSLVELHEEIEKLFEEGKSLDKRKKKLHNDWKQKINLLIDIYNSKAKFKTYNKIK